MSADRLRPAHTALLILASAFALRVWDFGNPVIHVDEQFYLLVGDRILHGAWPFLDVWDRKPVGLFLIFAAIRLLPGDGVLAYQIVATLFAAATAGLVVANARRIGADARGALTAGVAYTVWLSLLGGRGGQAPVFYNLFVAGMAFLALGLPRLRSQGAIVTSGAVACLLGGIAIQVKYTAAVEAGFFGAVFSWHLAQRRPGPAIWLGAVALWLALGLMPTAAAITVYAMRGAAALHAFWFANFTSIGLRPGYSAGDLAMRLLGIAAILSPLILAAAVSWWTQRRSDRQSEARIAAGAVLAATVGMLAIGTFFDHYALPLVAPLCALAAVALGRSTRILVAVIGLGLLILIGGRLFRPSDAAGARAVAAVVAANDRGACPYVFIGDTITYELAHACLPSAYVFPNLLAYTTEQGATGIDEAAEVRRILTRRPPVIVGSTRRLQIWNRQSLAVLRPVLSRDYRIVFSTPRAGYRTVVWLRRDLPYRSSNAK